MNPHLEARLAGFQALLTAVHTAGSQLSAAFKGAERERFVELFLAQMFPPTFRFGTGEITDQGGRLSGQIDVVVELPFLPSFPIAGAQTSRLYLAEGVAAAIEVKSNLAAQWNEVAAKAQKLAKLERREVAEGYSGVVDAPEHVPLFAVGYTGWSDPESIVERLSEVSLAGALVLDSGAFATAEFLGNRRAQGPAGLLEFLSCIWTLTATSILGACDPREYS